MKKLLITGGTVFVSRYTATYFVKKGYEVYVLNRGTQKQVEGVQWICADRKKLTNELSKIRFDAVLDICAYEEEDIQKLLQALHGFQDYIFISSSAVYPQSNPQPFQENQRTGENDIWGVYGTNKRNAERYLQQQVPHAYILRPPYLYGPMQNVYREPFVFACAEQKRAFYIPQDGSMKLQLFHVEDLCKVMEQILLQHPKEHILNVGNEEGISLNTYVELCYKVVKAPLIKHYVSKEIPQRAYFCFYDYEYQLDVSRQKLLLPKTKDIVQGLEESYRWYQAHREDIKAKDYMDFIDHNLAERYTC